MATFKASYKILRQQGDEMKAVAKMVDEYAERVSKIRGKLGDDKLLASVRTNLDKLREQLGESRAILNTTGEFLSKTVETYTKTEMQQVKKVDNIKAHKRDFYKNPVTVASAGGGAAAGAVAATAAPRTALSGATAAASEAPRTSSSGATAAATEAPRTASSGAAAAPAAPPAAPVDVSAAAPVEAVAAPVNAPGTAAAPVAAPSTAPAAPPAAPVAPAAAPAAPVAAPAAKAPGVSIGGAVGIGAIGTAVGAGGAVAVNHIMGKNKKTTAEAADNYDPETELEKARQRMKELQED